MFGYSGRLEQRAQQPLVSVVHIGQQLQLEHFLLRPTVGLQHSLNRSSMHESLYLETGNQGVDLDDVDLVVALFSLQTVQTKTPQQALDPELPRADKRAQVDALLDDLLG